MGNTYKVWSENIKERGYLEDLGVEGEQFYNEY
jgi:hypothetical protein